MSAYLLIDLDIVDLDGFMEYANRIPALIEKHSGKYVVQGVEPTVVQSNNFVSQRNVVLHFPSRLLAEAFLKERSQSDLHDIWARTTSSRILLVDGVG